MVRFREASEDDNLKLIQLTATAGMAGDVGLRIDRKPDFFALLKMRGPTKVYVAEEDDKIIGSICVSTQEVFVGGDIVPLCYIGDFKVAEEFRNKGLGQQLTNIVADFVIARNADLAFLNVSKGNIKPFSFFTNRPNVPDFENIGIFNIHQVIGKKLKPRTTGYSIEETSLDEEVLLFFRSHYRNYQLGTVLKADNFNTGRIFIIRETGKITAAMCLVDTMPVKQNVITSLSWKMKAVLKIINWYCRLTGLSKMPVLNEPVKMLYIKYLAVDAKNRPLVKQLINFARHTAFEKSYSYVSIGVHERDAINQCLAGLPKLTFRSVGMLLTVKNNRDLMNKVREGVPFEDYSLV